MTIRQARRATAFDADWAKYTDEHCSRRAGQTRSEDQHELKAGWFVYWHERRGNGKCVEWVEKQKEICKCFVSASGASCEAPGLGRLRTLYSVQSTG